MAGSDKYLRLAEAYLHRFELFLSAGLAHGFAHLSPVLGLVIALVAAVNLSGLRRLWAVAAWATFAHLMAETLTPTVLRDRSFHFPPDLATAQYWRTALALYLGYLAAIAVFYLLKQAVAPRLAPSH